MICLSGHFMNFTASTIQAGLNTAKINFTYVEQDGKGACHTGAYSCFFRKFGSDE